MGVIRRGLLKQTALYYEFDPDLGENGDLKDAVALTYVRYETNTKLMYGKDGALVKGTTWMIYDNVTSLPTGVRFKEQDQVTLYPSTTEERTYAVIAPSKLPSDYEHHQEVTLQ